MERKLAKIASALAVVALALAVGPVFAAPTNRPAPPLSPSPVISPNPTLFSPQQMATIKAIAVLDGAADTALDKGDYPTAEAKAREMLALGDFARMGENDLAAALYGEGKMKEAMQEYKKLNEPAPNRADDAFPYALLLLQKGNWAKAVVLYNAAVASANERLLKAELHFSKTMPQPVKLKAAILIGWGILGTGGSFHGTGQERYTQAQAMFVKASALMPKSAVAQYYIGYGLQRLNRDLDARTQFQKAAVLGDKYVKACVEAGTIDGGMNQVQAEATTAK